mmetsp:Transcript_34364/g.72388  ORF Transcript_34364/g.72388 Transcript_34364/m.72388 type:complete len:94 (+) Transcript_34364:122-403(+)
MHPPIVSITPSNKSSRKRPRRGQSEKRPKNKGGGHPHAVKSKEMNDELTCAEDRQEPPQRVMKLTPTTSKGSSTTCSECSWSQSNSKARVKEC